MRRIALSLATLSLALLGASPVLADGPLTSTLHVGSSGVQVALLQQLLNRDPDTRVAASGVGSPGMEGTYFGQLTKLAVMRFQTKYASEVLAPAGLQSGTGYVGSLTRNKLNALSALANGSAPSASKQYSVPSTAVTPVKPITPVATQSSETQNSGFAAMLYEVDKILAKQGSTTEEIAAVNSALKNRVAAYPTMQADFWKSARNSSVQAMNQSPRSSNGLLSSVLSLLNNLFAPAHAFAQDVTVPFGGAELFAYYCEDSGNFMLTMQPLPPSYATLLSYYPGTQAFLSYNIPATTELLGKYEPPGTCVTYCPYCVTIPTYGTILPIVGSSV